MLFCLPRKVASLMAIMSERKARELRACNGIYHLQQEWHLLVVTLVWLLILWYSWVYQLPQPPSSPPCLWWWWYTLVYSASRQCVVLGALLSPSALSLRALTA